MTREYISPVSIFTVNSYFAVWNTGNNCSLLGLYLDTLGLKKKGTGPSVFVIKNPFKAFTIVLTKIKSL